MSPKSKHPASPKPAASKEGGNDIAKKSLPIVGIGASAGGLEAFTQLLENLPPDTGMGFVLVQHMAPRPHSMLPELLAKATRMPVTEVREGMRVEPNHVYIIPPNLEMTLRHGVLHLKPHGDPRGRHRPVDTFLRSLALDQGSLAIGVILSGTASDGVLGMKAIKEEGGITLAQDEATAKYFSMPQSSIVAGCVDFILSPDKIGQEVARIALHPYVHPVPPVPEPELPPEKDQEFAQILQLLRSYSGVDFTYYKHATIKRRMLRRMVLRQVEKLGDYLRYLKENSEEVGKLYQDILINVTGFFRDPEVFEALKERIFPEIIKERSSDEAIRVWVPGCASGEEAYSIAMALMEFLGSRAADLPIQVFATDIEDSLIAKARAGIYPETVAADLSPERLRRFFIKVQGGYQVSNTIREMCIFARQNLIKDPPFSSLDLISCRNVLIYLGAVLQKKVIPLFHFALKPKGLLLLGKSETIGTFTEFFNLVDKKTKIYAKKGNIVHLPFSLGTADYPKGEHAPPEKEKAPQAAWSGADLVREADRLILTRFAPAGIIIDEEMKILQFRGQTGPYLEHTPGEASLNLMKMAREGLALELRTAVHAAMKANAPVRKEGLRVKSDGRLQEVNLGVFPLQPSPSRERFFLVVFEDVTLPLQAEIPQKKGGKPKLLKAKEDIQGLRIQQLDQELVAAKEYLQAVIEEQETTVEELKSTNEELMSSNEELQSINEELETSREELQSANEELATLNEELENRNLEVSQANSDLINLLSSVQIPIVMLGQDLRIRRFNSAAEEVMSLIPGDMGRSIGDLKLRIQIRELEEMIAEVVDSFKVKELEVQDRSGRWYSLTIRPYRTLDDKIDGAVLTLVDITAIKESLRETQEARDFSQAIVETIRHPLVVLDADLKVIKANRAYYQFFQSAPKDTLAHAFFDLRNRAWDLPELRRVLGEVLSQGSQFQDFETVLEVPPLGSRTLLLNGRRILGVNGGHGLILLAIEDVTERREAEAAVRTSESRAHHLAAQLLTVQEQERRRVALELHDGLGQSMATLSLRLREIEGKLPREDEDLRIGCEEAGNYLKTIIDEVRRISKDLSPAILEDLGLVTSLKQLLAQICQNHPLNCSLELDPIDDLFPLSALTSVYRIFQEALANVVAHAQATQLGVAIKKLDDRVFFQVEDNGVGFERGNGVPAKPTGMGLVSMDERVRLLGGEMKIWSEKGLGTKITFTIPLPERLQE